MEQMKQIYDGEGCASSLASSEILRDHLQVDGNFFAKVCLDNACD